MASTDGEILIKTKVDTSGIETGQKKIGQTMSKLSNSFSKNFDRGLTSATKNFNKISTSFTKLASTGMNGVSRIVDKGTKNIAKRIDANTSSITKRASSKFSNLAQSITGIFASFGAVLGTVALVDFFKKSVDASNELENALIGLQSIVEGQGKSFTKAKSFIEDYVKDGLVPAANATTAYKNLAMRGYSQTQIEQVMTALKDSAAFGRQSSLTLGNAVQSATEGLKNENSILVDNAGVTKNVSKMWQDYAKEIGVSVTNLTQQQKIQAEVNGIMQETRFQTGDAAKVANTFSGVTAALSYAFTNLKRAAGDFIKPILQALIPAITTAINWLTKLFDVLAKITAVLFGKKISTSTNAVAQNAQATQEATAGTLDNTNDLANATKKANKQAEKQLASFDEIQKISENIAESADSGGSSAGAGSVPDTDLSADIGFADIDVEGVGILENALNRIIPLIQHINELFTQGFKKGFGDIDTSQIESSLGRIKTVLKNIFTDVDVTSAAKKAADSFIVAFGTMVGAISSIGVSIATGIVGGIAKFLESSQDTIKTDLIQMFDIISEINGIVADWWSAISNIFSVLAGENAQNLVATVLEIFYTMASNITTLCLKIGRDVLKLVTEPITKNQEAIKQLLNDGLGFLNNWWSNISILISGFMQTLQKNYDMFIKPTFDRITELLTIIVGKVVDVWTKNILPILNNLSNKFREVIENQIIPAWDTMLEAMKPIFDFLFWAWDNLLKPLVLWLVDNFLMQVTNVIETISNLSEEAFAVIGTIFAGIADLAKGVSDFLAGVFTGDWERAWNGIKEIFAGVFNSMASIAKSVINTIISLLNAIIRSTNNAVSAMSKIPGMGWLNFRIPEIPRLAQGAVIPPNKEFLAILGDQKQGTNIETPLQTMIDAFNAALEQNSNTSNGQNITVVLELDKRELAKAVYKLNNQETQRVGIRLGGAY